MVHEIHPSFALLYTLYLFEQLYKVNGKQYTEKLPGRRFSRSLFVDISDTSSLGSSNAQQKTIKVHNISFMQANSV